MFILKENMASCLDFYFFESMQKMIFNTMDRIIQMFSYHNWWNSWCNTGFTDVFIFGIRDGFLKENCMLFQDFL